MGHVRIRNNRPHDVYWGTRRVRPRGELTVDEQECDAAGHRNLINQQWVTVFPVATDLGQRVEPDPEVSVAGTAAEGTAPDGAGAAATGEPLTGADDPAASEEASPAPDAPPSDAAPGEAVPEDAGMDRAGPAKTDAEPGAEAPTPPPDPPEEEAPAPPAEEPSGKPRGQGRRRANAAGDAFDDVAPAKPARSRRRRGRQ